MEEDCYPPFVQANVSAYLNLKKVIWRKNATQLPRCQKIFKSCTLKFIKWFKPYHLKGSFSCRKCWCTVAKLFTFFRKIDYCVFGWFWPLRCIWFISRVVLVRFLYSAVHKETMGGQKFDFTLKLLDRQESSNDYIMQNLIRKLSSRYLLHYALEVTKLLWWITNWMTTIFNILISFIPHNIEFTI